MKGYNKRLALMLVGSSLALVTGVAQAQEVSDKSDTPPQSENDGKSDIVVSGTRSSLENAERFKRDSRVLVDGISADDIGALPDESIADSLVRIPGLTANDNENGFAEVSVRGLGPDLANTLYNGRVLPSTRTDSRRLNLGDLPTEGISRAYVQKTSDAATIEGGLAGTIGLESIHPLETRRRGLTLVARAMTDDVSQDIKGVYGFKPWGYRGEVTYVGQLADNLGVAISYAHIQQTNANPSTQLVNFMSRTITPDADKDGLSDVVPNNAGINMGATNERRDSVLAMVQWRPTASLTASLDGYYIDSIDNSNPINFIAMNNSTVANQPTTYDVVDSFVRKYQGYTSLYQETVNDGRQNTRQIQGGFNLKFDDGGPISAVFDVSYAQARVTGQSVSATIKTKGANAKAEVRPFGYDATDPRNITLDFGTQSADDYMLTEIDVNNPYLTDTTKAMRLDFRYDRPLAFIDSMEFGMRVDSRVKDNDPDSSAYTFGGFATNPLLNASYLSGTGNPLAKAADYLGGQNAAFPLFDLDKLTGFENDPNAKFNSQDPADFKGDSTITENTMAFYYQANLKAGRHLTGNIGVRYFGTDEIVEGFTIVPTPAGQPLSEPPTPLTVKHSYHFWLPSLNLRYAITNALIVRGALSKTMSRPIFSDLRIGSAIDFSTVLPGATIVRGNPNLKPFTSKNADLDLEWYPSKAMTFALQGFYKGVTDFITDGTVADSLTLPDGSSIPIFYKTSVNDPIGRRFYGFEVIARRDFNFLPGMLSNLGLRLDYSHNWTNAIQTYASLDKTSVALTPNNFTPWIFNAQLYYSTKAVDIRLAYRLYSPYVRENSNGYQSRPAGTLDLSGGVTLRRGIRLIGTIRNLTGSRFYSTQVDYRYPNGYGLPRNVVYPGRSFSFGVRANF